MTNNNNNNNIVISHSALYYALPHFPFPIPTPFCFLSLPCLPSLSSRNAISIRMRLNLMFAFEASARQAIREWQNRETNSRSKGVDEDGGRGEGFTCSSGQVIRCRESLMNTQSGGKAKRFQCRRRIRNRIGNLEYVYYNIHTYIAHIPTYVYTSSA